MDILTPRKRALTYLSIWTFLGCAPYIKSDSHSLPSVLTELVESGQVLGAQAIVGENDQILLDQNFGTRSASDTTPVNSNTQFCIGSCSKPFASATILALSQSGILDLSAPISDVLPAFHSLKQVDSKSEVNAPSLLQLLAHRGGIYSQKRGMNRRQARWIRNFRLTLEDAVEGIAQEDLIFEPGTDYAYSGAGYCVAGRVGEVAADRSFESLFQDTIGEPLGLKRTTYFPDRNDLDIATGSAKGKPNPATPHLSKPFRLPLIGGSLYSTARETSRFARMILERGRFGEETILEPKLYKEFLSLPYDGQPYGLGWSVRMENGRPVEISHNGALASSRATIRISLDKGRYAIVFYTLTDPSVSTKTAQTVNRGMIGALRK